MENQSKELGTADFIGADVFNRYQTAIRRHELLAQAMENGVAGISQEQLKKAAMSITTILEGLVETYTFEAIQRGSTTDKINLPRFFRSATGIEPPADPAVLAEMAAARGHNLTNKTEE